LVPIIHASWASENGHASANKFALLLVTIIRSEEGVHLYYKVRPIPKFQSAPLHAKTGLALVAVAGWTVQAARGVSHDCVPEIHPQLYL